MELHFVSNKILTKFIIGSFFFFFQGSFDDTIVTINSTLHGHTETEGSPIRDFSAVLTAAYFLGVVLGGSVLSSIWNPTNLLDFGSR